MDRFKSIVTPTGQTQVQITGDELAALEASEAAFEAGRVNRDIIKQIEALEATATPRRIREMAVDSTWMKELDAQIAALRAKL